MARKPGSDDDDDPKAQELPTITPPAPKGEPWPDATPLPMKPVEPGPDVKASPKSDATPAAKGAGNAGATPATKPDPDPTTVRARTQTAAMGVNVVVGKPPEMPTSAAPPPLVLGQVESPTHMPGPKDVPAGNPDDPAPAPGRVPAGDSRSLRRGNEFALIYRIASCVITRSGTVGKRGQWRVVEYPTSAAASHGYAKECSRFVSEGFSDYRD